MGVAARIIVVATVAVVTLTCCSAGSSGSSDYHLGDGLTVSLDAPLLDGAELTASYDDPPSTPTGWAMLGAPANIELVGAELSGTAMVAFEVSDDLMQGVDTDSVGIATWDESEKRWQPIESSFDESTSSVTAKTTHFSWYAPWTWDWPGIGARVNQNVGELVGKRSKPARCERGESVPDWVNEVNGVSNEAAVAVRACVEGQNGSLVVELVNNRPYGQQIDTESDFTWAWSDPGSNPLETNMRALVTKIMGSEAVYLPPRGRATIALDRPTQRLLREVRIWPSGVTYAADIMYVVIGPIIEKLGGRLLGPLVENCTMVFADPISAEELTDVATVSETITSVVGCAEGAMLQMVEDGILDGDYESYLRNLQALKAANRVGMYLKAYDIEWKLADLFVDTQIVGDAGGLGNGMSVLAKAEPAASPKAEPKQARPNIVLFPDGLGAVSFGDPSEAVMPVLTAVLGQPSSDRTRRTSDEYLPAGFSGPAQFRNVSWEDIGFSVTFSDAPIFRTDGVSHLIRWHYPGVWGEASVLTTPEGLSVDDEYASFSVAYPGLKPAGNVRVCTLDPTADEYQPTFPSVFNQGKSKFPMYLGQHVDGFISWIHAGAPYVC